MINSDFRANGADWGFLKMTMNWLGQKPSTLDSCTIINYG